MAIDEISMEEKIEELRKAMPNQTQFVKGIEEDWIWLIKESKIKDKDLKEEFEETVEILTFNNGGQASIYEECSQSYSWKTEISEKERMQRINDLIYSKKQFELCSTTTIYIGDILGSLS